MANERAELNILRNQVNEQAAEIMMLHEKMAWFEGQLRDRDDFLRSIGLRMINFATDGDVNDWGTHLKEYLSKVSIIEPQPLINSDSSILLLITTIY